METVDVVTAFLRNRGEVLLLRRSDEVGSYTGQWGGVAGHAEGSPDDLVHEEIREETALHEHVTLVRRGDPFTVEDEDRERETRPQGASRNGERRSRERGTRWRVHPYLFDCDSRDVTPNEETTEWEWVSPTAILERDTVPDLWTSYDHVRPRLADVADDTTHGAAYLSLRALEVLRDEAALAEDWDAVAEVARSLCEARPAMPAVATRVDRTMTEADDRTAETVHDAAIEAIEAAANADTEAAANAADRLRGASVLTLSRSGTVREALRRADSEAVFVLESRPGGEGVGVAASLARAARSAAERTSGERDDPRVEAAVTLAPDATVAHLLATEDVDALLVGADSVRADGDVVNKVGTQTAATVAARGDCEVLVVCARDKIAPPESDLDLEPRDPAELYDGDADLRVVNPTFDRTPAALVDAVVTEDGGLDADDVARVAEEHVRLADWRA